MPTKDSSQVLILINFLISLILIFYMCIKMIWFYTHKIVGLGNNLLCMYLENKRKHKKAVPLNSHECKGCAN